MKGGVTMIDYTILILCVLLASTMLATAKCLVNLNKIDKRIDEIHAEEKRQNKRIENLEKRELIRQLEERRDKTYIQPKDLFKDW
jgi:hypothetical protein